MLRQLNELQTRDEGTVLQRRLDLSRKQLERLAKLRDIHITKVDNVTKMTAALIAIGRGVARMVILGVALSKL